MRNFRSRDWFLSVCFLLGALSYTAPEIFEGGDYSIQSDVYSLGCVILDMITCDTLTVISELEEWVRSPICIGWRNIAITHMCSTWFEYIDWNLGEFETSEWKTESKTRECEYRFLDSWSSSNINRWDDESRSWTTYDSRVSEFFIHPLILIAMNSQSRDIRRDDYVIESMHNIDANQVKYPSARDGKWTRDGIYPFHSFSISTNHLNRYTWKWEIGILSQLSSTTS